MALTSAVGRTDRLSRRRRTGFLAGAALGGATTATALFALSGFARPFSTTTSTVAIVLVGLLAIADTAGLPIPRVQNARQIPNAAFDPARRLGPARFGFEMGTGVRTYLTDPAPYVAAAAVSLVARPWPEALVVGLAFGLARGWLPLSRSLHPDRERWDRLNSRRHPVAAIGAIALIVVAALYGRGLI